MEDDEPEEYKDKLLIWDLKNYGIKMQCRLCKCWQTVHRNAYHKDTLAQCGACGGVLDPPPTKAAPVNHCSECGCRLNSRNKTGTCCPCSGLGRYLKG